MEAKKFRIGNFVTINNETYHPKIKGVMMEIVSIGKTTPVKNLEDTDYGIAVNVYGNKERITDPEYSQFIRYVEPLELTEKWITDFGFESDKTHDKYFVLNNSMAISLADEKIRFIQGNFVCQLVIREIKYVHELQNLFFAITGIELQYEELSK